MKFVMSYSCGKDSTLALHKMIEAGHVPVCLLVMINQKAGRSYFHGADWTMLKKYGVALGLPMIPCESDGTDYQEAFEKGLEEAKRMGAEAAAFGDIDLVDHRKWDEARCRQVGLTPAFPLWQRGRVSNVEEIIRLGYRCVVKSIRNTLLPESLLGRYLDADALQVMEQAGIDLCGENGEYHTLVLDGPIFKVPLEFQIGGVLRFGEYSAIEIG